MIEERFTRLDRPKVYFASDSLPHNLHGKSEWFNATINVPFDEPIVFKRQWKRADVLSQIWENPDIIATIKVTDLPDDILYKLRVSTPVVITNSDIFWTGSITSMQITLSHDNVNKLNIEAVSCNLSYVPIEFYRY